MTARKRDPASSRRERRVFTDEFKREAVRLLHERRAAGVTVTQLGRELDVRPDQLREWARGLAERTGGFAAAGGWSDVTTLIRVYQQPDPDTLLSVMSEPRKVTERKVQEG